MNKPNIFSIFVSALVTRGYNKQLGSLELLKEDYSRKDVIPRTPASAKLSPFTYLPYSITIILRLKSQTATNSDAILLHCIILYSTSS